MGDTTTSPALYRRLRLRVGSQGQVSRMLGVHRHTISRRERGALPITPEAGLALRYLALAVEEAEGRGGEDTPGVVE